MARTKKTKVDNTELASEIFEAPSAFEFIRVEPLKHEFGNGDMNVLRDKINEIIKHLS